MIKACAKEVFDFSQAVGSLMHNKTSRLLAYHSVFDFSFPSPGKQTLDMVRKSKVYKTFGLLETGKGSGSGNIGSSEISLSHLHNVVSGRPGPYLKTVSPKGRKLKLKIYHASCYK